MLGQVVEITKKTGMPPISDAQMFKDCSSFNSMCQSQDREPILSLERHKPYVRDRTSILNPAEMCYLIQKNLASSTTLGF